MAAHRGDAATWWAVLGVALVFVQAILALGERGLQTVRAGLDTGGWIALVLLTAAFVYGEGIRALQRRWVPSVISRAGQLRGESSPLLRILAPLYAMALVGASPRALVRAWAGVAGITAAVLIVRALPDPWRGIIDLAVAAALCWGLGAILVGGSRILMRRDSGEG